MIREDLLGEHEGFLLDDRRVVVGMHQAALHQPPAQIHRIGHH
jgi:hypothetical protein